MENENNNEMIEMESNEMVVNNETNNKIKIADEVVAVIAGKAVSEIQGVYEMSGGFAGGISEVLSGKKSLSKGIKVLVEDDKTKIDVNIVVEYGVRIPEIAFEIQTKVKKANVHVQGVNTNIEKKSE